MTLNIQEYKNKGITHMKNAKLLNRDSQKTIHGGSAAKLVCCDYDDNWKCIRWIGPGQFCP
ncbi:uncharacterized protein CHSO_4325 [Chryseobacterium sp. StRB126]|uniref:hypothetical protein n=1 Tax=Chryseobacterium sp. StRB126 TaxID=878220 RepID=UPI0004E994B5|nr:hypothetical protein [Chryseobacterium sp. StRB126]BAP33362.1 uncharacterized protein CHSO_4325 [Chryseobacterium sp. StRB126]